MNDKAPKRVSATIGDIAGIANGLREDAKGHNEKGQHTTSLVLLDDAKALDLIAMRLEKADDCVWMLRKMRNHVSRNARSLAEALKHPGVTGARRQFIEDDLAELRGMLEDIDGVLLPAEQLIPPEDARPQDEPQQENN